MQESRQFRRAKLAEAIRRHRHSLHVLKITEDKVPLSVRERHASLIQQTTEELHQMEVEYHDLNVQQIREESKSG
jgi:hypothetical protein